MRSNGSSPRSRCRCSGRNRRGWIGSTYDVDRPIRIVRDDPRTAEARLSPFLPEPAATRPDVTFRQLIRRWWDHPDDLGGQATSRAAEVAAAVAQARRRKTEHLGRPNRVGEIEQLLRYAKRACQRPNMGILDLPPDHADCHSAVPVRLGARAKWPVLGLALKAHPPGSATGPTRPTPTFSIGPG